MRGSQYQLVSKDLTFNFSQGLDPRRGLIIIMMDPKTRRPISLGPYVEKDIKDKARKEILAKILELYK